MEKRDQKLSGTDGHWTSQLPQEHCAGHPELSLFPTHTVDVTNSYSPHQSLQGAFLSSTLQKVTLTCLLCLAFYITVRNFKGLAVDYAGFALQRTTLSQMFATMQRKLCSLNTFLLRKPENDVCLPCEADRLVGCFCSRL